MKHTGRIMLGMILAVLMIAALPGSALAAPHRQAANEVTYDTPVEGAITDGVITEDWTLNAPAEDRITVRVERLDGNLVPSVRVLDNNGQEIANSYGADLTFAAAEISDFTLPVANTYTVRVERRDGENGTTTGGYRLTVSLLGAAPDHPANAEPIGPVEFDTPVTGEITPEHWWHVYSMEGESGDYIMVEAQRTSGILVPEVRLQDNNGQELTRGYASPLGDSATLSGYQLPYTGEYQVIVLREYEAGGDTTGGYELTVSMLGSGEDSQRLAANPPGVFEQYNTTQRGTITGAVWYQDWQFRTESSDTITIIARRAPEFILDAPNHLAPTVLLLDSTGQELTRGYVDYTRARAVIDGYTLPGAGEYTVRVTRDGLKMGITSGAYEVDLMLIGSGEDSPSLAEPAGTITAGTPVTGTLDVARWLHVWTFSGQEGQTINVEVRRTDGTLVPHLEIRDSNGVSQIYMYPDNTSDAAHINQFTLGYTGEYQIVVLREGEQGGQTTGSYELTVE